MSQEKLFDLYEKVYFSEIENKDKLHTRVQTIFSLIVIEVTVLTYLAKNTSLENVPCLSIIVILLTIGSFFMVIYSCFRLQKAFWGNAFRYLPTPNDINTYRLELIEYEKTFIDYCNKNKIKYENEHNPDNKIQEYIAKELMECTSWNIKKNEDRSSEIFESTKIFFCSLVPLLIAVIIFLSADLDSASPRKTAEPNYVIIPVENMRSL
ncbi:TPA: hypothetical protein VCC33_003308 [Kluyvera cryocrescens]|nr:hypothetical protein [Kluyvera cryocrescens]